jgi:hypothetical protein
VCCGIGRGEASLVCNLAISRLLSKTAAPVRQRHSKDTDNRRPALAERKEMTRVRVESFTISVDGYGAGPEQSLENPLGIGGRELHQWAFPTRTFQRSLFGAEDGTTGVDEDFAARGFRNIGAWILGRNMFGPIQGPVVGTRAGRGGGEMSPRTMSLSSS